MPVSTCSCEEGTVVDYKTLSGMFNMKWDETWIMIRAFSVFCLFVFVWQWTNYYEYTIHIKKKVKIIEMYHVLWPKWEEGEEK